MLSSPLERDKSLKAAANYDDTTGIRECQKTLEASKKACNVCSVRMDTKKGGEEW